MKKDVLTRFKNVEKLLNEASASFIENLPDFSTMRYLMNKIEKQVKTYKEDFEIIFQKKSAYGGGLKKNAGRVAGMKKTITEFENDVCKAEALLRAEPLFSVYRKKIETTKKLVDALKIEYVQI